MTRPAPLPNATIPFGEHGDQVLDLYVPDGGLGSDDAPIVFVHGGYWRPEYDRMHARNAASAVSEAGRVAVLLEYRRIPGDPDASVDDVIHGIGAALRETNTAQVVLVGHSAGGHLALVAANSVSNQVAGVLALAPISDLRMAEDQDLDDGAVRSFLGASAALRADLDPMLLPTPPVPTGLIHGRNDTIVPLAMSQRFAEEHPVELTVVETIGHYELIDPLTTTWRAVLNQIRTISRRT